VIETTVAAPPHQAIYRRWRAQTFGQIVGQEAVVETLRNAVRTNRVAHAILFVGPRGTGKTSLARILAKALNCTNLQDGDCCDRCEACVSIREGRAMDLVEIDAASNRGIDAIRELRERINYAPTDPRRKVYILDEAHQITRDAWNALLKSLEEPPEFVTFMFASTHPEEFPPAILSRLQRFDVRRLTTGEIEGKLARILEADGRSATPEALHLIARLAAGGMRDAESMLDQLLSSSAESLDEARVRDLLGLANAESIAAFVEALVSGDVLAGLRTLDALEQRGRDLRGFLDQVVEALRESIVGAAGEPALARHSLTSLTAAARSLAAIDPSRAGVGGLRLQLELALLAASSAPSRSSPAMAAGIPSTSTDAAVNGRSRPAPSAAPSETTSDTADAPEMPPSAGPAVVSRGRRASTSSAPSSVEAQLEAHANPEPSMPPKPEPSAAQARGEAVPRQKRDAEPPQKPDARPMPDAQPTPDAQPRPTPDREAPVSTGAAAGRNAVSVPLAAEEVAGELAVLRQRWPEVVARISAHPPTKPLIVACRPISVEDRTVTLGFPEDQAFLRTVADRRKSVLEEGIAAVLGHPVAVRCVATNLELAPPLAADEEAAFVLAEARRIFGDDLSEPGEIG
jgi:DNA polymerase III subunit gamma/tau